MPNTASSIRSNNDLTKISIGRRSIGSPDISIEDPYALNSKISAMAGYSNDQHQKDQDSGDHAGVITSSNGGAAGVISAAQKSQNTTNTAKSQVLNRQSLTNLKEPTTHSSQGADDRLTPKQGTSSHGVRPASRKREHYARAEAHANEGASGPATRESPSGAQKRHNTSINAGTMISRGQKFLNQQS